MQNVISTTSEIFERLKQARSLSNDADLARDIGVLPKKLAVWKLRNTVPLNELITYCRRYHFNLEAVLTGEGELPTGYLSSKGTCLVIEEPEVLLQGNVSAKALKQILADMTEEMTREVLKYAQEKKLLSELMLERQNKKEGV